MNTSILYCIVLMPVLLNACTFSPPSLPHTPVEGNWRLTWSDEFHGPEINPANWIFDIGGRWPGYPDDSTAFPQQMFIDWVRVYHTSDR